MKTVLFILLILSVTACSCERKKFDRGVIKEKFITSTKYGEPEYHFITDKHVHDVTGDEYAQHQVGDHYVETLLDCRSGN